MSNILGSVRYAGRMLWKSPGVTAAAVLALGLGIGLTTTVFSIVYGVLLRGLPFERSDRILHVENADPTHDRNSLEVLPLDYLDLRRRQTSFEKLSAFYMGTVNLSGDHEAERYDGAFLSADGFAALRVRPVLGRGISAADESPQANPVVVLSDGLWRGRYGADRQVIGRPVRMNGRPATIVGVMPPGFSFPLRQKVWVPLQIDTTQARDAGMTLEVFGRLRDGVSPAAAQTELSGLVKALEKEYPASHQGYIAVVKPYTQEYIGKEISSLLYVMLAFGIVVLLIACANVASLMVARASKRTRELAIRAALGAHRRQVVGQLLTESALLAAGGAVLGLGLAGWGVRLFNDAVYTNAVNPPPFWIHIAVDGTALLFVLGVTVLTAFGSGLFPALQASRTDVNEVLKDEGRGATSLRIGWLSRALVVSELAVCCALLVGAGLMVKSIVKVRTADLGYTSNDLLTVRVGLFPAQYPQPADRLRFFEDLIRRLEAQPGVTAVAVTSALPAKGSDQDVYEIDGVSYPDERNLPHSYSAVVSAGYFRTFGSRILAGRDFGPQDRADGAPVALVNQSFAARVWPHADAVGRRLRTGMGKDAVWRTVVGVVPDLGMRGLQNNEEGPEGFYTPMSQQAPNFASLVVATHGDPLSFIPVVRQSVLALDHDIPVYFVQSMAQVVSGESFFFNLFGVVFGTLGLCALVLASVGIYGVIAFSVQQRTQEIGVRMALGAHRGNVLGMILKQGSLQLAIGLGAGLLLAALSAQPMRAILFEVDPTDPPTYLIVVFVLCTVAISACLVPARRAARLDPLEALRA